MITVKDIVAPRSNVGTQMGYAEVLTSTASDVFVAVYKVEESLLSTKGKLAVRCGPVEYIPAGGRSLVLFARRAYSSLPGRTLYLYWHSLSSPLSTELSQNWSELVTARNIVYQLPVPPRRIIEDNRERVNARAIRIQDIGNGMMPMVIQGEVLVNTPARTKLKIVSGQNGVYRHNTIAILSMPGSLSHMRSGGNGQALPSHARPVFRVTLQMSVFGQGSRYHGRMSSRIREIIRSALYEYDVGEWKHDRKHATVTVSLVRKMDQPRSPPDEVANIEEQFGDSAVDGWMEGDIRLSPTSKYELALHVKRIQSPKTRKPRKGGRSRYTSLLERVLCPIPGQRK
jgi:hypothetical protein